MDNNIDEIQQIIKILGKLPSHIESFLYLPKRSTNVFTVDEFLAFEELPERKTSLQRRTEVLDKLEPQIGECKMLIHSLFLKGKTADIDILQQYLEQIETESLNSISEITVTSFGTSKILTFDETYTPAPVLIDAREKKDLYRISIDFVRNLLRCIKDISDFSCHNLFDFPLTLQTQSLTPEVETEQHKTETDNPQEQYELKSITAELQYKLLENHSFWENVDTKCEVNIFEGISGADFLNMVRKADFSPTLNKKGITQRVRKNITILQRVLGHEWAERAAKSINTTIDECYKRNDFNEWKRLKGMYK
jgi:hypothetical protein